MPCIPDFKANAQMHAYYTQVLLPVLFSRISTVTLQAAQVGQSYWNTNYLYEVLDKNWNGRKVSAFVEVQVWRRFFTFCCSKPNTKKWRAQCKEAKLNEAMQRELPHIAFLCGRGW